MTTSSASAAVFNGNTAAVTSFSTTGGATCTRTVSGTSSPTLPLLSNGTPATVSTSGTSVATDSGDLTDVTTMSASATATTRATEVAGSLRSFDMTARVTAAVNPAQGVATSCDSSASGQVSAAGTFVIAAPSILDLTVTSRGGRNGNLTFVVSSTTSPLTQVVQIEYGASGKSRRVVALRADTYSITVAPSVTASEPDGAPSDVTSSTVDFAVHGLISGPGKAVAAPKGTGKKYLSLPSGQNCAKHTVAADFTKAAGQKPKKGEQPKISKATFFVDGAKVKSVKKPHKNTVVTLKGLSAFDELEVEALLKVRGKGTVAVTRTYLPCS